MSRSRNCDSPEGGPATRRWLLAIGLMLMALWPAPTLGAMVLVSHTWGSPSTRANDHSYCRAITPDGLHVLFYSHATDLVPVDTNGGVADIFLYDRTTGTVEMIVPTAGGVQPDEDCYAGSITPDLRYVGFNSSAPYLVPEFEGGYQQSYVYDRVTGAVEIVSVADDGTPGGPGPDTGGSSPPDLSADGRYACFQSTAANLVPGDTNGVRDIFVHDRWTGHTERVNVAGDGTQANDYSLSWWMTPDGHYIGFSSKATNLVLGDTNGYGDAFVLDRATGLMERVSVTTGGAQVSAESSLGALSGDGRFAAFGSYGDSLVPGDANGEVDSFVRDRVAATTELVSCTSGETQYDFSTWPTSISADGRFVAFYTNDDGIGEDPETVEEAFLRDRVAGTTDDLGSAVTGPMSANGRAVVIGVPVGTHPMHRHVYLWEPEVLEFGTISGTVRGLDTGAPIAGAQVLIGGTLLTVTDANGDYSMVLAVTGGTPVSVSAKGYLDAEVTGIAVTAGQVTVQDFVLYPQPPGEVLLEVHPNERAQGYGGGPKLGTQCWTSSGLTGPFYLWKVYQFDGSADLWIQVCAQNFNNLQNSSGKGDMLQLKIDGQVPDDVWGIMTGWSGLAQWRGDNEHGDRYTLEFQPPGLSPGQHVLKLAAKETPILWWVKVVDLAQVTEQ